MKATQRDFAALAPRAAKDCALVFLCGPDEAGAAAGAARLVEQLADPGERVELTGAELKGDPARLVDEARSASLFGTARHVLARVTGDEAYDAAKAFLELKDVGAADGACPVIILAVSATDRSRTAKLLAPRKDALVAMFWPPDLASVTAEVRRMADGAGLRLEPATAERIARGSGLDVRLAGSEIAKLALYLDASPQAPRPAGAEDFAAIGAVTEEDGVTSLVDAVLSGALDRLPGELSRMRAVGLNPVTVALALERRAAQLARLAARLGEGIPVKAVLDAERVFYGDRDALQAQLRQWGATRLERLVERLARLHRALLTSSAAADLLLAQMLVEIARAAARRSL